MGRLPASKIKPISGASLRVIAFAENQETGVKGNQVMMLGRGTGMSETDDFGGFPINELGFDGVEEIINGQHTGSFVMQKIYGRNQYVQQYLPNRDEIQPSHLELPLYTFERYIVSGQNAGQLFDSFRHCLIRSKDGSVNANGVFAGSIRVQYCYHNNNPDLMPDSSTIVEDLPTVATP